MSQPSPPGADRPYRSALVIGVGGVVLSAPLLTGVTMDAQSRTLIAQTLGYFGAALLVAAQAFVAAGLLARARAERSGRTRLADSVPIGPLSAFPSPRDWALAHMRRARAQFEEMDWRGNWLPVLVPLGLSVLSVLAITVLWPVANRTMPSAVAYQILAGSLVVVAFPLLVLERHYAGLRTPVLPEAPQLAELLRVPLVCALALAVAAVFRSLGYAWPRYLEHAVAVLIGLVAIEIILRCAARFFLPTAPLAVRTSPAHSTIAGLIRFERPSWQGINIAVRRQFGIDLSRSWAIAFTQRAVAPVLLGLIVFGWLITGVTALGTNERAVYEAFGDPVCVFGPGLHVHLPWPFGILRPVEFGVVHEIPIVFAADDQMAGAEEEAMREAETAEHVGAEDIAPATADRLWDTSHPSEASYLVAANSNGRQNFQIVNIDLRIVYRVGLSDEAARDAVYQTSDTQALIRAASGRMLVRHFARYTLLDVLGQNRDAFVGAFKTELQARLNALSSGIDVIAVVVEAIHPPPEAANAYHGVQAAEISSKAQIDISRADAIRKMKSAQETATTTLDDATAGAAERVDLAQGDSTLFGGDRDAYAQGGQAFLFERWLDKLGKSLSQAPLVIVDHRLGGENAPTIDLRKIGPGTAITTEADE